MESQAQQSQCHPPAVKVGYLDAFSVLFIKGANIKSICCIDFSPGRNQGGRVLEIEISSIKDELLVII